MGALDGVRVLDFSRLAPGPYCSMLLGDMGAAVIRVDRPGDEPFPPFDDPCGRGKRSVVIDLRSPDGADAARRLAARTDVILEGFRPGVMERAGLGPRDLPDTLVYARLTGWGQGGPLAARAGHDINYIALSGVLSMIARAGERPLAPVNLVGDFAGGSLFCAFGIVSALLERERSGRGQVVDAAMLDGAASLTTFLTRAIAAGAWGPAGTNLLDSGAHFYDVYETSDRRYVSVGAIEPQFYAELLDGLGLAAADLPPQMDRSSWPAMKASFARIFQTRTRDEWATMFEGGDACVQPVLEPAEAREHPHNAARGLYTHDPDGIGVPAVAPRLDRTPGKMRAGAPAPGAHTREVLEEAGYTNDEIDQLHATGAVASPG